MTRYDSSVKLTLATLSLAAMYAAQLPGGRHITPYGEQFRIGPGAFGMAVSPSGRYVATAGGGMRFSVSVLDNTTGEVRHFVAKRDRDKDPDDDGWRSVFMGIAFDGESRLWLSEGESGKLRLIDVATGRKLRSLDLNQGGYRDSFTGDLAYDAARGLLFIVDQANFRMVVSDGNAVLGSVRTGRLPFGIAYDAARREAYVTNLGMFEYRVLAKPIPFPAFGFPSAGSAAGLGDPNAPESNSLAIVSVDNVRAPKVRALVRTGLPFGASTVGGSSPSGVATSNGTVYVSNGGQDTISVIDAASARVTGEIGLRIPGFEKLRGVLPIGLAIDPDHGRLLVAEAGINAVGVVDLATRRLAGHIPTGWFPAQVCLKQNRVFVSNVKGEGTGPNSDPAAAKRAAFFDSLRRGTLARFEMPSTLDELTQSVLTNAGFAAAGPARAAIPEGLDHVVIIVKENRTYDEVFGDLGAAANGERNGIAALARLGRTVTPNHHAMAERWATSDNFYADSEVSVDGHHWIVDAYPNAWTTSALMASYGGQHAFRLQSHAPGRLLFAGSNSSVHPEEQPEAGSLWHHLERHGIPFRNYGEGFELAGIDEGPELEPTGASFTTNVPMPEPLYRNTSRIYPGFNMNIPDQYRVNQFIREMSQRPMPRLLFMHLPNDHMADARPGDGYPVRESFVADNDFALGRVMEFLSRRAEWGRTAVFITEDDAQGGVDHVDSHRTVLIVAGPYARKNWVSHTNASFPSILRTAFEILRLPPLNQFDAAAPSLADCFTSTPDKSPYRALPVEAKLFDPAKAKAAKKPSKIKMDDPRFIEKERSRRR